MKKSSLIIQEPPLQVLPSLAVVIGLNEALIIQQLHYWLENPKVGVTRDGFKWIFNTYDEWKENFPFWSTATIQRIFINLEKMGLVIAEQLDAKSRDMRKFYRIDYEALCAMQDSNLLSSNTPTCYDVKGTTEITTETTTKKPLSAEKISKIKQAADKTVDAILATEKHAAGKTWTNLPEPYHAYGRAFCEATGLNYHKKYLFDWIGTFDEWQADGFTPERVTEAVSACRNKGMDISRPGSITWKLRAQKSSSVSVASASTPIPAALTEDTSKFVPPPAHLKARTHATTH